MRVTEITSRTVKTYVLHIEDGEVRAVPYSRTGKQYRVDRLEVVKKDGNVSSLTLRGAVLKKDGSDSLNWADERVSGEPPTWVARLVKVLS